MAEWRQAILKDVKELPRFGVPGNIVVFGSKAESILTSISGDSVIAASEYGTGRGVIFPQGSYIKEFNKAEPNAGMIKIIENIKKWLCRGSAPSKSEVVDLNGKTDFDKIPATTKVLLWWDTKERSQAFKQKVSDWVKNGGGIVFGTNPWGYLSGKPERQLEDIPFDFLFKNMGVCLSRAYLSGSGSIPVQGNKAENANISDIIKKAKGDVKHLLTYRKVLENALSAMPDSAVNEIAPGMTEMVKAHTGSYHSFPTSKKPVNTDEGRALASMMNRMHIKNGKFDGKVIPPGTEIFPGMFTTEPTLREEKVTVKANGKKATRHPTGLYVPPGQTLQVILNSPTTGWSVQIGAHSNQFYNKTTKWTRWPQVSVTTLIRGSTLSVFNPFGGSVYLKCPDKSTQQVTVTLKNVVKTPLFDITKDGAIENWKDARKEAGLWADIYGERMGITLPASAIRNLDSPAAVMEIWDEVCHMHIDLRGMHKAGGRREWVVTDQQPGAGYMHSGYPIVTKLDVADPGKPDKFLLEAANIRQYGRWGVFHELGHNQQDKMWTFSDGAAFEKGWRTKAGVALGIYSQLARDMGWDVYKAVFREYDRLDDKDKPKDDNEKIDQWIIRFSTNAQKNLCPMFDFWGFPIRDSVRQELQNLPAFLHEDETTSDYAPDRAEAIRKKYGMLTPGGRDDGVDDEELGDEDAEFQCNLTQEDF